MDVTLRFTITNMKKQTKQQRSKCVSTIASISLTLVLELVLFTSMTVTMREKDVLGGTRKRTAKVKENFVVLRVNIITVIIKKINR